MRALPAFYLSAAVLAALFAGPSSRAYAQGKPIVAVRVRVADSSGVPIKGADVAILRGVSEIVVHGVADDAGQLVLSLAQSDDEYQLVVRRIGYQRASQFFRLTSPDQLSLSVTLERAIQRLPTITATAKESLRRQKLLIDADSIAASGVSLDDAVDVVRKLRPSMVWGMGGPPGNGHVKFNICDSVTDIWVNGQRILAEMVPTDAGVLARYKPGELISNAGADYVTYSRGEAHMASSSGNVPAAYKVVASMETHVLTVLSKIHPEHIDQMQRLDCLEASPLKGRLGTDNAIFIVLKRGVAFDVDRGSYVVADTGTVKR